MQMEAVVSSTSSAKLNQIVRAGAGAGKTHNLVETVYNILSTSAAQKKEAKIVLTTFTRKAAQELKERLLLKALSAGDLDLVKKISSPNFLHISTIHGVLSRFLSQQGYHMGIPPQFGMMDEYEELRQTKRLLRKAVEAKPNLFSELLEEFRFGELAHMLRDLMRSLLFDGDKRPLTVEDQVCALKAELVSLGQSASKLSAQILSETDKEAWVTFAQGIEQMAKLCESVSEGKEFELVSRLQSHWEGLPRAVNRGEIVSPSTVEQKATLKKKLDLLSGNRSSLRFFERQAKIANHFYEVVKLQAPEFLKQKLERAAFTMQDLEDVSWLLINAYPVAAQAFSKNWTHWFIDELQDTSPRQMQIFEELSRGSPQYLVGDPQQSIYLFRGARAEVFEKKLLDVRSQGGVVGTLMKNFRSHPTVIEFINEYFHKLSPEFQPMDVGFSKEPKPAEVQVMIVAEPPESGPEVKDAVGDSAVAQVNPVAKTVEKTSEKTREQNFSDCDAALFRVRQLLDQGAEAGQICILSRDNESLIQLALRARAKGLETVLHSSGKYSERVEVIDALTVLKFLVNPHDNLNVIQLLRMPWWRVSDHELHGCLKKKPSSYWSSLSQDLENHATIQKLKILLDQCKEVGISEAWIQAMVGSQFLDSALHLDPSGRREANLWKLIFLLKQKERAVGFSYLKFLEELTEIDIESNAEADATPVLDPDKVNLMTVHGSKGLQFEHIIIVGMGRAPMKTRSQILALNEVTQKFALSLSDPETQKREHSLAVKSWMESQAEAEKKESNRVLYVAMTRAIYSLTLLWKQNPAEESWAGFFPLSVEPGRHQLEKTSYFVVNDTFAAPTFAQSTRKSKSVREPWSQLPQNAKNLSVTQLLEAQAKSQKSLSLWDSKTSIQLAQKGTEVHRQFENLKYGEFELQKLRNLAHLNFVFSWGGGRLLQIITNGHVEWSYVLQAPWGPVQGQVDLWGHDEAGVYWVVDYKTGSSRHSEKAMKQLKFYLYALRELGKIPVGAEVRLAVLYLSEEKIIEEKAPEQLALLQELQAIDSRQYLVTD